MVQANGTLLYDIASNGKLVALDSKYVFPSPLTFPDGRIVNEITPVQADIPRIVRSSLSAITISPVAVGSNLYSLGTGGPLYELSRGTTYQIGSQTYLAL